MPDATVPTAMWVGKFAMAAPAVREKAEVNQS
jgi:hypothetical protein